MLNASSHVIVAEIAALFAFQTRPQIPSCNNRGQIEVKTSSCQMFTNASRLRDYVSSKASVPGQSHSIPPSPVGCDPGIKIPVTRGPEEVEEIGWVITAGYSEEPLLFVQLCVLIYSDRYARPRVSLIGLVLVFSLFGTLLWVKFSSRRRLPLPPGRPLTDHA